MGVTRFNKLVCVLAVISLACISCAVPSQYDHGIPNFSEVAPGIWRGGQPTEEGWLYLRSLGADRTVKLNTRSEASDALAAEHGLEVVYFPINSWEQTAGIPNEEGVRRAVAAIRPGTFVHCQHGWDRTGLIIGAWRVTAGGWTKAAAYDEMVSHGFHSSLYGLYRFWREKVR